MMRRFDIGLMPLPDNPYTRAKSGYKILQYWAAGLPVVASPVGFNRNLIAADGDGLFAESIEEWVSALTRLAEDPDLRGRLGAAGREKAVKEYSLASCAPKLARLLDDVTAG
jgi:glycosyltransferase involved in cell wall biosynthesis